jgi:hypothetical protein
MSIPRIRRKVNEPDGRREGFTFRFDYRPVVLDKLREAVPGGQRRWMPSEKEWWVWQEHARAVAAIIGEFFPAYEVVEPTGETFHVDAKTGERYQQEKLF